MANARKTNNVRDAETQREWGTDLYQSDHWHGSSLLGSRGAHLNLGKLELRELGDTGGGTLIVLGLVYIW